MEFSGKTVEEATAIGLKELGLEETEANIEVKLAPVKGLFGRIKGQAIVEITKKETSIEKASNFLQQILDILQINARINISEDKQNQVLTVITDKSSSVIGYRGEVLDALQTLAGAVANIGREDYKKVIVDCENYRTKREEILINLAHKLEAKAVDMKREVWLEPMTPFERRIIHTALAESTTVTTRSDGKEPNRFVVIVPNEKDEFLSPYNAGRNKEERKDKNSKSSGRNGRKEIRNNRPQKSFGSTKKSSFGFGTYLGNSLKDKEE